jgi:hypothetical protein
MTHRLLGGLHARLVLLTTLVGARVRVDPQRGQGTVEYVALILLVAGVLATAVAAAHSTRFDLAGTVTQQLKNAIGKVSGTTPK